MGYTYPMYTDKEKAKLAKKAWKAKNPEKVKAEKQRYYQRHKQERLEYEKRWKNSPEVRERLRLYGKTRRSNVEYKYKTYQYRAEKKGRSFKLSLRQFGNLIKLPCAYCGSKEQIGIDRVDNSKGYEVGNVAPACWPCNKLKRGFSKETYINLCIAVAKYNK